MGLLGAAVVGGMVGRRSARRQMAGMQKPVQAQQAAQAQQTQQAAQPQQAAQAQQTQQAAQPQQAAQASAKTDPMQEIAKLEDLKAKGPEEEFQTMKANLIAKT